MADDALSFGAGLVIGVIVVAVLVWIVQQQQESSQSNQTEPDLSSYNVVRDDQGRIQNVEALRGLPVGGGGSSQREPRRSSAPQRNGEGRERQVRVN